MKILFFFVLIVFLTDNSLLANSKMNFWSEQKKGANSFNNIPLLERYQAAKDAGLDFLRITPSKWLNGRPKSELGDFLLGRPSKSFTKIVKKDIEALKIALDKADKVGMKIVLTMLSLPGNRWSQHNGGKQERNIWRDFSYHEQSAEFWKQIAIELKDHPSIVAYNLKNEPAPEHGPIRFKDWYTGNYDEWYKTVMGTPQDINLLYSRIIKAIREVDQETPIMIDSGYYGTPWAFKYLKPVDDKNILYSFHMYEPYAYAKFQGNDLYSYPGKIPIGEIASTSIEWNIKSLRNFLKPISDWATKNQVDASKIVCGEFGLNRFQKGAVSFLEDQMKIYSEKGWHWAFYTFREDDGGHVMDYELGQTKPGWEYWKAIEAGKMPGPNVYNRESKLWDLIQSFLKQKN